MGRTDGAGVGDPWIDPYAPPSAAALRPGRETNAPTSPLIAVFGVLNLVFSGFCGLGLLLLFGVMIFGVFFSGDERDEMVFGLIGLAIVSFPFWVGLVLFLVAGVGLLRHKPWGYYFHIAGAALAALSVVGLVYTIFAFVVALHPDFTRTFFPPTPPSPQPVEWGGK
jgi:hypothetical protein